MSTCGLFRKFDASPRTLIAAGHLRVVLAGDHLPVPNWDEVADEDEVFIPRSGAEFQGS
jgi:hypothetical protein